MPKPAQRSPASPTDSQYLAFRRLFTHFNDALFGGTLPHCLLTFSQKANTHGYYRPEGWQAGSSGRMVPEIALCPESLRRPRTEVLSTLVHEMAHLWQSTHGKPGRGRYHNEEWAAKMEAIGLMPSASGMEGGKRTGDKMTHYTIKGGRFEVAAARVPHSSFLPFLALAPSKAPAKPKTQSKVKYSCETCEQACWGKPELRLQCADCDAPMLSEA